MKSTKIEDNVIENIKDLRDRTQNRLVDIKNELKEAIDNNEYLKDKADAYTYWLGFLKGVEASLKMMPEGE